MDRILFVFLLSMIIGCNSAKNKSQKEIQNQSEIFQPYIERLDPDLDDIISPTAKVEIIADGFDWTEGPLWVDGLGLLFSDIPPNNIYLWTKSDGVKLYLKPSGYTGAEPRGGEMGSNGLLLDADGNLVLCQHGDRRLASMNATLKNPKADFITIINAYQNKKFNSPNDACYDKNGNLYFTDPPYGLEKGMKDPLKELTFQGVFKYSNSGELHLVSREMSRPNGIGLSPDEKTLYVANSDSGNARWIAFSLNDDGVPESWEVFHDATDFVDKEKGLPDGLKVDSGGNIFATGPGGIWIFNEKGKVLGKIRTGQATSNCAFGNNGKVLYITADMYVMKVDL